MIIVESCGECKRYGTCVAWVALGPTESLNLQMTGDLFILEDCPLADTCGGYDRPVDPAQEKRARGDRGQAGLTEKQTGGGPEENVQKKRWGGWMWDTDDDDAGVNGGFITFENAPALDQPDHRGHFWAAVRVYIEVTDEPVGRPGSEVPCNV